MIKNEALKKVPLVNKLFKTKKVWGDEGKPFIRIYDDYKIELFKDIYIHVFEITTEINFNKIYNHVALYNNLKGIHFQLFQSKYKTLLIAKYKDEEKMDKVNVIKELEVKGIKAKKIKIEEYIESLNKIMQMNMNSLSDVNKKTKSSKNLRYKINHITTEDRFFRILEVPELPNEISLEEINNHCFVSFNFTYLSDSKKNKVYSNILNCLESKKNNNKLGYKNIQPYRLNERIKKVKGNKEENNNIIGVGVKLLVTGNSKEEIENKTNKIKKIAASQKPRFIIKILTHEQNKENFCSTLPINYRSTYTPAFLSNKAKITFFNNVNIRASESKLKNKVMKSFKGIESVITDSISSVGLDLEKLKKSKNIIPIKELYENGVMELNNSTFSAIVQFKNINYILEREEDKKGILEIYKHFINTVDEDISIQLYIKNKDINKDELKDELFIENKKGFEKYIKEYNLNLENKLNDVAEQTSKTGYYFVVNVKANSIGAASKKIRQTYDNSIVSNFSRLKSKVKRLSAIETEKLIYDSINNPNEYERFIDSLDYQKDLKNKLLSSSYSIKKDHIQQGRNFQQVVYLKKFANKLSDTFLNDIIKLPFTFECSVHIKNLQASKAINKVKNKIVSMESDKMQKQERSDSDYVPFELEKNLEEGYYILNKLQYKDQKLFTLSFYITIAAKTKDQLKANREILNTVFSRHMCDFDILKFRQEEGLLSTLPFGIDKLKENRALLTENVKYIHPFDTQNIYHPDGIFYGLSNTNNILSVNRKKYQNPSAFFLGVPGSGKSFTAKMEMISVFFKTDDDIIIIDPEREYGALVEALGGEVIKLSTSTDNYINPMKLSSEGYTDKNISTKIEFLITFLEKLTGEQLRASSKSIIDRVLRKIYEEFKQKNEEPVLKDFYKELMNQEEEIAKKIALDLEIYIRGSLNIFAQKSNISTDNRVVCYDIKDLKDQLKTPALTAILDSIWDTFSNNRAIGKYTWLYIDEIYLLFNNESSSEWLFETWKRIRKYLGVITGITQNISDLLQSHTSSTMLSNSEFKLILNQSAEDRQILVDFLGISESQKATITNAQSGTGLLMAEENVVPFSNRVNPKDIPELFDLINTSYGG